MKSWKREALSIVVGLVAVVIATMVTMTVMAFVDDLPPAGPECTYKDPGGYGSGGTGYEEISWSLLPIRACVKDSKKFVGDRGLWTVLIAGAVGVLAAGTAASLTDRHLKRTKP